MATVFTRIIDGELPGRFVWRDDRVVAFIPITLLAPGHTLVVPIEPVDHWIDVSPRAERSHLVGRPDHCQGPGHDLPADQGRRAGRRARRCPTPTCTSCRSPTSPS